MDTTLGSAVICQLENAKHIAERVSICDKCYAQAWEISAPLKRCVGCLCRCYCSKECQRAHWAQHKPFCNLVQGKGAPNAFLSGTALDKGPKYVLGLIIDSYRIRVEHDHLHRDEDHGIYYHGQSLPDGNVFANSRDVEVDFQNYLDCAEKAKVLPLWWDFYKRLECLTEAVDRTNNPQNIFTRIDEGGLISRYNGDTQIRCTLIFLAELIVGYEATGPPKDAAWIASFKEYVNKPERKKEFEKDSINQTKATFVKHGRGFPPDSST